MSTTPNTPPPVQYESSLFKPKRSLLQRVNWRIIVFVAIAVLIPGYLFGTWLGEVVTGGIHNYGNFKGVDLKAMSTFDMDQHTATMQDIPEKWRNLEGQEVRMVGEMWAPQSAGNGHLGYFQLVYSKTKCCFSGPPLAQHFVDGNIVPGAKCYYYDVPVEVYGKVHIGIHKDDTGVIKSVYHVDVEKVVPIEE